MNISPLTSAQRSKNQCNRFIPRPKLAFLLILVAISLVFRFTLVEAAQEFEDDDGEYSDFGWAAVAFCVLSGAPVIVLGFAKFTIRVLSKSGRFPPLRNIARNFYRAFRNPLTYIHYLAGAVALIITFFHGIPLLAYTETQSSIGLITTIGFLLYVVSGLIIKMKISVLRRQTTLRRVTNKFHSNLILFILIIILHIFHVAD